MLMKRHETIRGGVYETLPTSHYFDPAIFEREKTHIFHRCWQLAGHVSDIPNHGDFFVADISGKSIVVLRGKDDMVRGFYNVCIHRGHELLTGKGCVNHIICPYHAWMYDTTGQLQNVPNGDAFPGLDVTDHSLNQVNLNTFMGLILINLDKNAIPFEEFIGDASDEIRERAPSLESYVHVERTDRNSPANWKIEAENFNDCYHCPVIHKTLTSGVVDPTKYRTRKRPYGILHESPVRPDEKKSFGYSADANRKTDKFITWWFWPLFVVQVYPGGHVNTCRWKPVSLNETRVEVDWWMPSKILNSVEAELIKQQRETTFYEDGEVVKSVQRGLESGGLEKGMVMVDEACSSLSEHPIVAFHEHYFAAMGDSANGA